MPSDCREASRPRVLTLTPLGCDDLAPALDGHHDVELVHLADVADLEVLSRDADVVVGDHRNRVHLDRRLLRRMWRCRLVQQPSVGFESIDCGAAAEFGIPVANAAGYNADAVAEWTVMATLVITSGACRADAAVRRGGWRDGLRVRRQLSGMTVGVAGLGAVGRAVVRRLMGFGCDVLFHDPRAVRRVPGRAQGVSWTTLVEESDVLSLHVPLEPATRHLLDTPTIGRMKRGAYLVNSSRGVVVDEAALTGALADGHLAGAALDVFSVEPLPLDSQLRQHPGVLLSPHWAGTTEEAESRLLEVVGDNIRRVLDGRMPRHVVNGVLRRGRPRSPTSVGTETAIEITDGQQAHGPEE